MAVIIAYYHDIGGLHTDGFKGEDPIIRATDVDELEVGCLCLDTDDSRDRIPLLFPSVLSDLRY